MNQDFNKKHQLQEYQAGINRVIDYIEQNIDKNLTLDELAKQAFFSKYHFHRIFCSLVGETLFQFIQRLRMEKAAFLLSTDLKKPITEIAFDCGFSGSASFARSFKTYFKTSPSLWRKKIVSKSNLSKMKSKSDQLVSKKSKEIKRPSIYIDYNNNVQKWRFTMKNKTQTVKVKDLSKMTVAYVRYVGPYVGDGALFERLFGKLCKWAGARGLLNKDTKYIIVYHDNLKVTEESKQRVSVCAAVPEKTKVEGEVGKMTIPAGKYAMARFEKLTSPEFIEAWNWVYAVWLPQSGYALDDRPAFELYPSDCKNEKGQMKVDICIPVKPL